MLKHFLSQTWLRHPSDMANDRHSTSRPPALTKPKFEAMHSAGRVAAGHNIKILKITKAVSLSV